MKRLTILAILIFPFFSFAALFQNSYVSFELPPNWKCDLDGTEWTCTSKFEKNTKEAIIILTAKEAGPSDSLSAYEAHLKQPKSRMDKSGRNQTSKVINIKKMQIANHTWIDGLHLGSEINSYYTRYLATIKDRLAIAVTFSAHKSQYTKYSSDFLNSVKSLKLIATKNLLANAPNMNQRSSNESFGVNNGLGIPTMVGQDLPPEPTSGGGIDMTQILAFVLILGAAGVYFWRRKKK